MDIKPPKHLSKDMKAFFKSVVKDYELEPHHVRLLTLACEASDRAEEARRGIEQTGMMLQDRFGQWRTNPLCMIYRDALLAFSKLVKQLGLDDANDESDKIRIPNIQRSKGLKIG